MSVGRYVCMHVSGGHARCGVFCVCIVYVCTSKCSFVCQYVCMYVFGGHVRCKLSILCCIDVRVYMALVCVYYCIVLGGVCM